MLELLESSIGVNLTDSRFYYFLLQEDLTADSELSASSDRLREKTAKVSLRGLCVVDGWFKHPHLSRLWLTGQAA